MFCCWLLIPVAPFFTVLPLFCCITFGEPSELMQIPSTISQEHQYLYNWHCPNLSGAVQHSVLWCCGRAQADLHLWLGVIVFTSSLSWRLVRREIHIFHVSLSCSAPNFSALAPLKLRCAKVRRSLTWERSWLSWVRLALNNFEVKTYRVENMCETTAWWHYNHGTTMATTHFSSRDVFCIWFLTLWCMRSFHIISMCTWDPLLTLAPL